MLKFSAFFVVLFFTFTAQAREIDRTLVLVNGDVILHSDLSSFHKNFPLRKEIDPFIALLGVSATAKEKELLDYLVQERLVVQKHSAQEDEIEEEINAVQRNNRIDRDRLKEVLRSQGVKFDDYRRLMAVSVSKRKLVEKDLRPLAAISDDDVKNFYYTAPSYQDRRKEQRLVLSYGLQQMILPNADLSEAAQKKLRAGEDFDSVAADLAARGVESSRLGTLSEENMNPKIREAIQGLKLGDSTQPIAAGNGYMILRILEIGAPKDPVFEKDKEPIRNELFQKKLLNQLSLWTERERASSYIHNSSN